MEDAMKCPKCGDKLKKRILADGHAQAQNTTTCFTCGISWWIMLLKQDDKLKGKKK